MNNETIDASIMKYFDLSNKSCFQSIDDNTCEDLNLNELFHAIDFTYSSVGKQYLYCMLRTIPKECLIAKHESWIAAYSKDEKLKAKIKKPLSVLNNPHAYNLYPMIMQHFEPYKTWQKWVFRTLQFIPFASLLFYIFSPCLLALILLIISFSVNMVVHFISKKISLVYSNSIGALYTLLTSAKKISDMDETRELDPSITNTLNQLTPLKKKLSIFRINLRLESEFAIFAWVLNESIRAFFLLNPTAFSSTFFLIDKYKTELEAIFEFVGLVDTLQSVNTLREENASYCHPQFIDGIRLSSKAIYHPLIRHCVSNSFSLNEDSFLILGSNMAGKTSFVRTVGINVLLAQTLNMCFAEEMILQQQKIFSAITVNDSISKGHSYYLSEVLRIKLIVEETKNGANLILLDELFKGTNTLECIAASNGVLEYLAQNIHNRILVATHNIELADLLKQKYTPIYFTEDIAEGELKFNYKIEYENSKFKNAIRILELFNFPSAIVKRAFEVVGQRKENS